VRTQSMSSGWTGKTCPSRQHRDAAGDAFVNETPGGGGYGKDDL
jgi:N-methylhydantoinase B/oxoprolinase/acetone carboxylase alpha subunit